MMLRNATVRAASAKSTIKPALSAASARSLATVADPPVRRYGGLKDQDRIFTNLFCRGDHGIKGAKVRGLSQPVLDAPEDS